MARTIKRRSKKRGTLKRKKVLRGGFNAGLIKYKIIEKWNSGKNEDSVFTYLNSTSGENKTKTNIQLIIESYKDRNNNGWDQNLYNKLNPILSQYLKQTSITLGDTDNTCKVNSYEVRHFDLQYLINALGLGDEIQIPKPSTVPSPSLVPAPTSVPVTAPIKSTSSIKSDPLPTSVPVTAPIKSTSSIKSDPLPTSVTAPIKSTSSIKSAPTPVPTSVTVPTPIKSTSSIKSAPTSSVTVPAPTPDPTSSVTVPALVPSILSAPTPSTPSVTVPAPTSSTPSTSSVTTKSTTSIKPSTTPEAGLIGTADGIDLTKHGDFLKTNLPNIKPEVINDIKYFTPGKQFIVLNNSLPKYGDKTCQFIKYDEQQKRLQYLYNDTETVAETKISTDNGKIVGSTSNQNNKSDVLFVKYNETEPIDPYWSSILPAFIDRINSNDENQDMSQFINSILQKYSDFIPKTVAIVSRFFDSPDKKLFVTELERVHELNKSINLEQAVKNQLTIEGDTEYKVPSTIGNIGKPPQSIVTPTPYKYNHKHQFPPNVEDLPPPAPITAPLPAPITAPITAEKDVRPTILGRIKGLFKRPVDTSLATDEEIKKKLDEYEEICPFIMLVAFFFDAYMKKQPIEPSFQTLFLKLIRFCQTKDTKRLQFFIDQNGKGRNMAAIKDFINKDWKTNGYIVIMYLKITATKYYFPFFEKIVTLDKDTSEKYIHAQSAQRLEVVTVMTVSQADKLLGGNKQKKR